MNRENYRRWYVAGAAAIGLLIGLMTGASNSPVAGTVIPLVFALLGGAGGFHILKADLKNAESTARLRFLGMASVGVVAGFVLGMAYGVAIRSPHGWAALIPRSAAEDTKASPWIENSAGTEQALEVFLLRRKLALAGASSTQIDQFTHLATRKREAKQTNSMELDRMVATVEALARQLESLEVDVPESFDDYRMRFWAAATTLHSDIKADWSSSPSTEQAINVIDQILDDSESVRFLMEAGVDLGELALARRHLSSMISDAGRQETSQGALGEQLDSLIQMGGIAIRSDTSSGLGAVSTGRGIASVPDK